MKKPALSRLMGGWNSGREEYATTATVNECESIDVNWMNREGLLDSGTSGTLSWSRGGEKTGSIRYGTVTPADTLGDAALPDRVVALSYTTTHSRTDESTKHAYPVEIATTPCNFGGSRPWFLCPGKPDGETCGRRVGKLHSPPLGDLFLCRHCHDLGYRSSRRSRDPMKAAQFRYQHVHEKLAPDADTHHPGQVPGVPIWIEKPKGMHRETHDELQSELPEAYFEWKAAVDVVTDAMSTHFRNVVEEHDPEFSAAAFGEPHDEPAYVFGYGYHGQCEATAKTTGERCGQAALGEHGKCFYHGGAPGSGIGEDQRDHAAERVEELLAEVKEQRERDRRETEALLADLDDDGTSQEYAEHA
jgi:hypothetical protein